MDHDTPTGETINFRTPILEDGKAIYELIKRCPPLDLNSSYLYLLLADHFAGSCILAETDENVVGFVSAYLKPQQPDTLFVWQVAVDSDMRGQQLGSRLLQQLYQQLGSADKVNKLETTISPSNAPSQKLFARFAKSNSLTIRSETYMPAAFFSTGEHNNEHEAEDLYTLQATASQ